MRFIYSAPQLEHFLNSLQARSWPSSKSCSTHLEGLWEYNTTLRYIHNINHLYTHTMLDSSANPISRCIPFQLILTQATPVSFISLLAPLFAFSTHPAQPSPSLSYLDSEKPSHLTNPSTLLPSLPTLPFPTLCKTLTSLIARSSILLGDAGPPSPFPLLTRQRAGRWICASTFRSTAGAGASEGFCCVDGVAVEVATALSLTFVTLHPCPATVCSACQVEEPDAVALLRVRWVVREEAAVVVGILKVTGAMAESLWRKCEFRDVIRNPRKRVIFSFFLIASAT